MDEERDITPRRTRKQSRQARSGGAQKTWVKVLKYFLIALLIICAWASLIYAGYDYSVKHLQETELFFASQIDDLKQANTRIEEKVTSMLQAFQLELEYTHLEVEQIRSELQLIQEELALTGETITGTDHTRLSLQDRITELDKQLASLREQLKKLEDAVRAF